MTNHTHQKVRLNLQRGVHGLMTATGSSGQLSPGRPLLWPLAIAPRSRLLEVRI